MRTAKLRAREGKLDWVVSLCKRTAGPALERQDGFMGMTVGVDREQNAVFTFTLWQDEESMLAGERGEYLEDQVGRLLPFLEVPPEIGRYEVAYLS